MFTGIVEIVGTVKSFTEIDTTESGGSGASLVIRNASEILGDCHLGDSIAINGTCLTVTEFDSDTFKVGLAPETLHRTNLGSLKSGDGVNLERALAAGKRFGGHFVQGHVDTTASIVSKTPEGNSLWFKFKVSDASFMRYIIPKGFIAIDGTSLTVCDVDDEALTFTIMLVAYTQTHVIMPKKDVGHLVNIEVDMLGKYTSKIISAALLGASSSNDGDDSGSLQRIAQVVKRVLEK
ncbi:Riboflavin synthase alpha chain [Mycoemilia scoparia]|uniref:Riboflavin synthase n=1 Tax=Mycoemilia scoparia TaxID=417184 RepID=A0A9W8DLJ1_9FUNG|nr:Riboflavin synthase alpha chain [Mycoemilia scoparia]